MSTRIIWSCLLAVALAGCNQPAEREAASDASTPGVATTGAPVEESAPPVDGVELLILNYDEIQGLIAAHHGKVVVMDAWSTSCLPCRKEFHNLVDLHQKHKDDVACLSLSFDYEGIGKPQEQAERVLNFLNKQGATFENILSSEESESLYRKFHLTAVPAVFVYDQSGKLVKRFDNEKAKGKDDVFTYQQVFDLVEQLLREPKG